jgi:hypothetical protein
VISRFAAILVAGVFLAGPAAAQTQPQTLAQPALVQDQRLLVNDPDAQQTREELQQLFRQYPPSVRQVLALDPSLLTSDTYLATYPQLVAFLRQHPEVARNPTYFLGSPGTRDFNDPQGRALELLSEVMTGLAVFSVFAMVSIFLGWMLKSFIDYRRWMHVSKVQTEAHNKLLDRLTGHEELLAYIQTPAGRRFLESAPVLDAGPRQTSAPINRVLWSAQIGMVLAFAGFGLNFAAGRVSEFISPPIFLMGVLAIALGVGFVISAGLAYVLSRRLGLLEPRTNE